VEKKFHIIPGLRKIRSIVQKRIASGQENVSGKRNNIQMMILIEKGVWMVIGHGVKTIRPINTRGHTGRITPTM
jgi:hypothetical protein